MTGKRPKDPMDIEKKTMRELMLEHNKLEKRHIDSPDPERLLFSYFLCNNHNNNSLPKMIFGSKIVHNFKHMVAVLNFLPVF